MLNPVDVETTVYWPVDDAIDNSDYWSVRNNVYDAIERAVDIPVRLALRAEFEDE